MSDIFISYKREEQPVARKLADALENEGWTVWWDPKLRAGERFNDVIEKALSEAKCVIVLWSERSVKSLYVKDEATHALKRKKLVPVTIQQVELPFRFEELHTPSLCGWDGSKDFSEFRRLVEDISTIVRPSPTGVAVGEEQSSLQAEDNRRPTEKDTNRAQQEAEERRLEKEVSGWVATRLRAPHVAPEKLRSDLLAEVKGEVTARLAQSLHYALLMKLGKETKPQEVRRHWDVEVKVTTQQSVLLAPDTEIIEIFDEESIAGKLLILGAPGAGKTTTLLQLARELVERAETDTREPMPVLLNLSSWKDDSQTIASWLVDRMHVKYGIRKDMSQRWLDERSLLPLFDGLDELEPARQEKCVQAINKFQQAFRPEHLVVCCRLAEYQNCQTKLELNGAVHLQPLTDEQIHHYLSIGQHPELWNDIHAAPELLELARSPLLLSIMALVYEEGPIKSKYRLGPTHEGRKYLFDMYIERMLSRVSKDQQYARDKTLHWLGWLARGLRSHAQTEFLLETLQPSWLESPAQKLAYRTCVSLCVSLIVVAIFLVSFSLKHWMMGFLPKGQLLIMEIRTVETGIQAIGTTVDSAVKSIIIIIALIAGLSVGLKRTIKPIETLRWSGAKAWAGMVLWFQRGSIGGLKYGAYIGQIAGLVMSAIWMLSKDFRDLPGDLGKWRRSGQIAGVILGVMAWLATLWIARSRLRRISELWDWQMIKSAEVLISGLIFGLAVGLRFSDLLFGILSGLGIGLIAGISRNHSDRPIFTVADGVIAGLIGWLLYGVLTWFIGRQLLKGFTMGLFVWLDLSLLAWLGIGATFGLAAGLIAKLRPTAKPVGTRQDAGIESWGSLALRWRQWLVAGAAGGALVASLVLGLVVGLGAGRTDQAIAIFFVYLGIGLIMTLPGPIFGALGGIAIGLISAVLPVALIGALTHGLTGPDIERRTMPNQGIRQAAANAWRFALIGGLVLGSIDGLCNLVFFVLWVRLAPDTWDWFRFCLGDVPFWALIAALVPGAACIQHFTLRFILWCRGVIPWHYARFLDYATERMFLQRVGGRYRFIHDLLRDHFAAIDPKQ